MRNFKALLIAVLAAGCSGEPETDIAGLAAMHDQWQAAFDARDAAAVAAIYAANGTLYAPNSRKITGRTAIQVYWDDFLASGVGGQIDDTEVFAGVDVGYKIGTYMITDPAGAPADVGKYVEIWRHIDGKWQLLHDIYNSDMPLPALPPPPEADDEVEVIDDEAEVVEEEAEPVNELE
jgi:uncharacterized protein (TIGR02246 family)